MQRGALWKVGKADSEEKVLLAFRQLLKTHVFCSGPRRLATAAFTAPAPYKCTYFLTYLFAFHRLCVGSLRGPKPWL